MCVYLLVPCMIAKSITICIVFLIFTYFISGAVGLLLARRAFVGSAQAVTSCYPTCPSTPPPALHEAPEALTVTNIRILRSLVCLPRPVLQAI